MSNQALDYSMARRKRLRNKAAHGVLSATERLELEWMGDTKARMTERATRAMVRDMRRKLIGA